MPKNFLTQNTELLRQIDAIYENIHSIVSNKKDYDYEVYAWLERFDDVWAKLVSQLQWPIAKEKKSRKRILFEKIFPSFKEKKSVKLAILSKFFPSLKYLISHPDNFFIQSPILQKESTISLTFPPNITTYKTIYGFNFCSSGLDVCTPIATGHYDPELSETLLMLRLEKYIDVFIDVGANLGFYSLLLAKESNERISVFACEPESKNLKTLNYAISLNQLQKSITVLPIALGEARGNLDLHLSSYCYGCHSLEPLTEYNKGFDTIKTECVEINTLDNITNELGLQKKNCFIKMDVEGYEAKVLAGGQNFLNSENQPIILLEAHAISRIHPKNNHLLVLGSLKNCGYDIFTILHPMHNKKPLRPFYSKNNSDEQFPTINYLAIPKSKIDLLEPLNQPIDIRIFSSSDMLNSVYKFLNGSCSQLKERVGLTNKRPEDTI